MEPGLEDSFEFETNLTKDVSSMQIAMWAQSTIKNILEQSFISVLTWLAIMHLSIPINEDFENVLVLFP